MKTRGGGSALLVQNDMSHLETPTAVAFRCWHPTSFFFHHPASIRPLLSLLLLLSLL
jgi:hypothetical protein